MSPPRRTSRRRALAALLGAYPCLRNAAASTGSALRIAISETMIEDVNLNDARAAMQTWIRRLESDLNIAVEMDSRIFSTTEDIARGIRSGQLDAAALNLVEFKPIASYFDPSGLLMGIGASGPDEYLLLARRDSRIKTISQLRGGRLNLLKAPKMCVAQAWLTTVLDDEQLGPAGSFFGPMTAESKISRVVLPVFFRQTEACLTSQKGYQIMCELNPQVNSALDVIARSPRIVTCFYAFSRQYRGPARDVFLKAHNTLLASAAGRQLATLFQFDELTVADGSVLAAGLGILEKAEHIAARQPAGATRSRQ